MTAKLVSRASRLSSKVNADAAAASRLQGALAGEDDNPLFLGGIRVPPAEAITDAMGAAIATGDAAFVMYCSTYADQCSVLAQGMPASLTHLSRPCACLYLLQSLELL